ncbi:MAG: ArdC-like ssDNA-binding domain-containing protein, partial [Planctomycetota bacterium]
MKNKVYDIITERIIDMLKKGVAPWHRPWKVTCLGGECGAFFNLKTKKPYRGANVYLLSGTPFASPYFVTFKQAKDLGGMVRKGEQGFPVIFWKRLEIEEEFNGEKIKKTIPFLRYYTVFNTEQCEGLEDKLPKSEEREATEEEKEQVKSEALNEADNIVENMPKRPDIFHGGNRACYKPMVDVVNMPEPKTFKDLE